MIVTFYNQRINKEIVTNQKKVFEKFGIELNQIDFGTWTSHGKIINDYLKTCDQNWEYLVLFDIDCIPLNDTIVSESIKWVQDNIGIIGVAQRASHIPNSIIYAGPAFFCISRKTYEFMGRPTFDKNHRSDCGGEFSYIAEEKGVKLNLLYPTNVEVPKWDLNDKIKFGFGTNFENKIYHAFESRFQNVGMFVKKCQEILN